MYKTHVTTDDDTEQFECYTDGSLWNGWASVYFTREQFAAFMAGSPYDYRFMDTNTKQNRRDYPVLIIYFEDEKTIESSPIGIEETGEILEAYPMDGFCFMYA